MAQAVRPFCARGGGKEDTGPPAVVVSPLLDEHRSLTFVLNVPSVSSLNAVHWGIALGSSKQPSALTRNVCLQNQEMRRSMTRSPSDLSEQVTSAGCDSDWVLEGSLHYEPKNIQLEVLVILHLSSILKKLLLS